MRRRRIFLFLLAVTLVVSAVGAWLLWPRTAITVENAARIQQGMILAEAEAILGGPARDETTGPLAETRADGDEDTGWAMAELFPHSYNWRRNRLPAQTHRWQSDHVLIRIDFDEHDRVLGTDSMAVHRVHESPWAMLRRWLGI